MHYIIIIMIFMMIISVLYAHTACIEDKYG